MLSYVLLSSGLFVQTSVIVLPKILSNPVKFDQVLLYTTSIAHWRPIRKFRIGCLSTGNTQGLTIQTIQSIQNISLAIRMIPAQITTLRASPTSIPFIAFTPSFIGSPQIPCDVYCKHYTLISEVCQVGKGVHWCVRFSSASAIRAREAEITHRTVS